MSDVSSFQILFVCTANLCRSQLAEARFRRYLLNDAVIGVSSAGTRAIEGTPIPGRFAPAFDQPVAGSLLASHLTSKLLADADLVLTMTRSQRSDVVQIMPRCVTYTYTLTQFVELAETALFDDSSLAGSVVRDVDPRRLLDAVRSRRGATRAGKAAVDIDDPAHGGARQLRKVSAAITDSVDRLATAFQVRSLVQQPAVRRRSIVTRAVMDAAS